MSGAVDTLTLEYRHSFPNEGTRTIYRHGYKSKAKISTNAFEKGKMKLWPFPQSWLIKFIIAQYANIKL